MVQRTAGRELAGLCGASNTFFPRAMEDAKSFELSNGPLSGDARVGLWDGHCAYRDAGDGYRRLDGVSGLSSAGCVMSSSGAEIFFARCAMEDRIYVGARQARRYGWEWCRGSGHFGFSPSSVAPRIRGPSCTRPPSAAPCSRTATTSPSPVPSRLRAAVGQLQRRRRQCQPWRPFRPSPQEAPSGMLSSTLPPSSSCACSLPPLFS